MKSTICESPNGSAMGRTVGSSSVALGDWLMSPSSNLEELSSPSNLNPANQDLCFSPGMFSPTKGNTPLTNTQDDNSRSIKHFSPSIFSPNNNKLLKKRHHMSPPPSLENMFFTSQQVSGFAPSSSHRNMYYSQQTNRPNMPDQNQHNYNLYGVRDRKRRVFHDEDVYNVSTNNPESTDTDLNHSGRLTSNKLSRRFSPSPYSPANEDDQRTQKPHTVSPTETSIKCNCKKSKCLKLYCECFAALKYCDSCNCMDCSNNEAHEPKRQDAIRATKDRNVCAFQTKVALRTGHATGCNCKNSMCLKKYCECFQGGAYCANNCKCISCQNFQGSAQLEAHKRYGEKKRRDSPNSVVIVSENNTPSPNMLSSSALIVTSAEPLIEFSSDNSNVYAAKIKVSCGPSSCSVLSAETRQGLRSSRRLAGQEDSRTKEGSQHSISETANRKSVSFSDSKIISVAYPFFGANLPEFPKVVALQCLDFLNGKDLQAMSVVNSMWAAAATDDALWQTEIL